MTTMIAASSEDRVRAIAYALWLEEGQPEGRADAHWLKANEIVQHEHVNVGAATAAIIQPKRAAAVKKAAPRKRS